jgi:hypothetical protein
MYDARTLRKEAATCRELAREITDLPSVRMLLERAEELEAKARALEDSDPEPMRLRVS